MVGHESDNNLSRKVSANRLFVLDEFLTEETEGLNSTQSLSLSEDLQSILEDRKLYSFNQGTGLSQFRKEEEPSHIDGWYTKKRRRPYTAPWAYYPAEKEYAPNIYSARRTEPQKQKLCLGLIKKTVPVQERSTLNSILPLYLNATTSFEGPSQKTEFLKISNNFLDRVCGIDYDALTVQQLKTIMKEFGLAYTGKKHELITRIQQTCHKIKQKQNINGSVYTVKEETNNSPGQRVNKETKDQKDPRSEEVREEGPSFGFMFF